MLNQLQNIMNSNNEISTLDTIVGKITDLQNQLNSVQAQKSQRLEDSLYSPNLFEHYQKVAHLLAQSSIIPRDYIGKPENIFVAMAMGYQLGFPVEQALNDISVINGRPCLWGDGLISLALNHPACESIDEKPIVSNGEVIGYECTVVRTGHMPHTQTFTLNDARVAGLTAKSGPWKSYPKRMLQMRARNLAIRDKFPDALRGLMTAEIVQEDATIINSASISTSKPTAGNTKTETLKKMLSQSRENINENTDTEYSDDANAPDNDKMVSTPAETDHRQETVGDTNEQENVPCNQAGQAKKLEPLMIAEIMQLMDSNNYTTERRNNMYKYYGINKISDMTIEQAEDFIAINSKDVRK